MDAEGDHAIIYPRLPTHTNYQGFQWYSRAFLACIFLTLCFLIAGLTLGVCGLDSTWLQMRSITGTAKQRKQVRVIMRMKQNASWMLCSMVICSVACSEYFPFVIHDLCGAVEDWVPVLLSTLLLAVFAEVFPQWLIPRHAVSWGYYCWPVVWGCMWLTAIVSFPLAWLLDSLGAGRRDVLDVFTKGQLGLLIKYHERSEKRGGDLSPDATRVILGVLNNDDRKIGGDLCRILEPIYDDSEKDIEKAEPVVARGLIVHWPSVKTIDINAVVDKSFIEKVKSWSYSRIPVVGKPNIDENGTTTSTGSDWEGSQVFGFLHIKNLIGLDPSTTLFVKDLPLYPLPIVRNNISVFELLYMFQLGMSRMAVVVPASYHSLQDSPLRPGTTWTGTERTKVEIESRIRGKKDLSSWTTDYLAAAQASVECLSPRCRRIQGIRSPKPIGIITFEDIVDALLQRTSRDEKDFFARGTTVPLTKITEAGDSKPRLSNLLYSTTGKNIDISVQVVEISKNHNTGTLRRRKCSKIHGVDGAADFEDCLGLKVTKLRKSEEPSALSFQLGHTSSDSQSRKDKAGSSSYTQNSQGGFHDANGSSLSINIALPAEAASFMKMTSCSNGNTHSPFEAVTLPTRRLKNAPPQIRHFSAVPRTNLNPLTSSFSADVFSIVRTEDNGLQLTISAPSKMKDIIVGQDPIHDKLLATITAPARHVLQQITSDNISLSSWGVDGVEDAHVFNADEIFVLADQGYVNYNTVTAGHTGKSPSVDKTPIADDVPFKMKAALAKPYDGFPPELLDLNKENHSPNYSSKTMPRFFGLFDDGSWSKAGSTRETHTREKSFHDDRAMLPSQRRALTEAIFDGGGRSSSL